MADPALRPSAAEAVRRDPFRIFFPLGVMAGILGVGQWIPWSMGKPLFMASFLHSSLQSQGFLACFIVGFLLTALPRFTGAPYATGGEVSAAFSGAFVFCAGILARRWEAAQAGFLLMLAVLPVFAFRRLRAGTKGRLPPSFLLLAFGLIHAAAGSAILAGTRMGMSGFDLFESGRWMVGLGFPLCMVLGVTGKVGPFLMGHAEVSPKDESPAGGNAWAGRALVHGAAGALILLSFLAESAWPRAAAIARAAVAAAHLMFFARIGRFPLKRTASTLLFWVSCWMVPAGLWLMALFPGHRIAFAHVVFIGGFSLMIFSFGLLIVLTHTARADALKGPLIPLKAAGALVLTALVLRLYADFYPARQMVFLLGSSASWVAAAVLWLGDALWKAAGPRSPRPAA